MHILLFILIFIIAIFVFGLSIVGFILRTIFGLGRSSSSSRPKQTESGRTSQQSYNQTNRRSNDDEEEIYSENVPEKRHKKIFTQDDGEYVDMYYAYPNVNPELLVDLGSSYVLANANFDVNYYNYQDINLTVTKSNGDYSNEQVQYYGNLSLKAAIEGWNNCLVNNTPYTLASIGFNSLCNHNLTRSYYAATLSTDGTIEDYCYKCGYHEDTDIPCVSQVKLSKKSFTYNGKVQKPSVTVIDSKGNVVSADNYSVSYSNSGSKKVGSYGIYISFIGSKYSGSISYVYKIIPKSSTISSLKGAKKKITVKYKKQTSQTTGYQIQVATDKAFKKNKKTVTVKKNKTTSANVSSLKAKKKYFVRVRTYKTVNGKKIYSSWSKVKTIKTK